jgi:hypothetical protein
MMALTVTMRALLCEKPSMLYEINGLESQNQQECQNRLLSQYQRLRSLPRKKVRTERPIYVYGLDRPLQRLL